LEGSGTLLQIRALTSLLEEAEKKFSEGRKGGDFLSGKELAFSDPAFSRKNRGTYNSPLITNSEFSTSKKKKKREGYLHRKEKGGNYTYHHPMNTLPPGA